MKWANYFNTNLETFANHVDTGRKLNVHKTYVCSTYVLCLQGSKDFEKKSNNSCFTEKVL